MTNKKEPVERIYHIIAQELGVDLMEVTPTLSYSSIPEWDSVGHMHIIAALEEAFDFYFDDQIIGELTTPALIAKAVIEKTDNI